MTTSSRRSLHLVVAILSAIALLAWLWPRSGPPTEGDDAARQGADTPKARGHAQGRGSDGGRVDATGLAFARALGSISGTITSEGGRPLGGASVCAWLEHADAPSELTREPRCTTSTADGRYRLADLPPLRVTVSASAPAHVPATWEEKPRQPQILLRPGQERTGVDLDLAAGGVQVHGIVRDIAGGVVEGALVTVTSREAGRWSPSAARTIARSDDEGRFTTWAVEGNVSVQASAQGYSSAERSGVAPGLTFELFMTPESIIVGRVVLAETGAPVPDAIVSASGLDFGSSGGRAISDAEGRFRIDRLQPGAYHPSAANDTGFGRSTRAVHVGLAQTSDEVIVELHPAATVSGVVLGDGKPCTDGWVRLARGGQAGSHSGQADGDGRVQIRAVRPGTYQATARCDGHVTRADFEPLDVQTAPVQDQRWELSRGTTVRGTVVDERSEPISNASLWATAMNEGREGTQTFVGGQTDDAGAFEIEGLAPGRYAVRADAHGHLDLPEPITIEVGERDPDPLRIVLSSGGSIEGRVVDARGEPVAGATVQVKGSSWSARATALDDGTFRIDGAKPGDHRVVASKGWSEELRAPGDTDDAVRGEPVRVVAGEVATVELVVEAQDGRIAGRVLDATGAPVSDAFIGHTRESDSAAAAAGRGRQSVRWGQWRREGVLTDDDGTFVIDQLAQGKYTLRAYRKGGGEALVEQVEVGTTDVELRLEDTGSLSGQLTLAGGGVPDEFKVTVNDKAIGYWQSDEFYKTAGAFTMSELPAGDFDVTVTSEQGDATTTVSLKSGEARTGLSIELTPKVRARGRVIDLDTGEPVPAMRVIVNKRGGFSFNFDAKGDETVTDAAGRFEVRDAPAGRVVVMVMPRNFTDETYGWDSMLRDIPATVTEHDLGDLQIVKQRRKRTDDEGDLGYKIQQVPPDVEAEDFPHRVAFVRPNGPADLAGLKVGDIIERVDGHDVTGFHRARYSALTKVTPGTTLSLGLAGDTTVTLTAGTPP